MASISVSENVSSIFVRMREACTLHELKRQTSTLHPTLDQAILLKTLDAAHAPNSVTSTRSFLSVSFITQSRIAVTDQLVSITQADNRTFRAPDF